MNATPSFKTEQIEVKSIAIDIEFYSKLTYSLFNISQTLPLIPRTNGWIN